MRDGVLVELALFIGVALARAGVGRLRVPTFTLSITVALVEQGSLKASPVMTLHGTGLVAPSPA